MKVLQQDWAAKWAVYSPQKIALKEHETGRTLTYEQLNDYGNKLAAELTESVGLKKGDRIAVLSENCLEYHILFVVAQKTGCILVPLNYRLASAEIDYLLQNCDPKLIIWESKMKPKLEASELFSKIKFNQLISSVWDFCQNSKDVDFQTVPVEENDPVFILYTSGTTGFPKGAIYSHKMLFWNSINTSMSLVVNTESRTVNVMPPFHTGGWNVLTTPFLHHGGYTCILKKFEPESVLQLLENEEVTIFMGVPTMLKMIADLPEFSTAKIDNLLYIIVGGEPMPIPLIEQWHEKGVAIRQGYGMTEVGPNLTSLHQDDAVRKKGSIGRPNYYVEIKIVDENNQETAPNVAGELLLRGPMTMPAYWQNEEGTKKTFSGDWFKTGDMVRQDEEGYLYVVDRIKNMYISGGENVYPAEVERILISHPQISEAAVVSIPDEKWGESGKAFVVKTVDSPLSEKEVIDFCKTKLAKFKVPKVVVFLDELPKNDTGKIDRKRLRE